MLKLIGVNVQTFAVQTDKFIATGTLNEAKAYLIDCCGVEADAIQQALEHFSLDGHNVADFGINGGLTYTTRDEREAA